MRENKVNGRNKFPNLAPPAHAIVSRTPYMNLLPPYMRTPLLLRRRGWPGKLRDNSLDNFLEMNGCKNNSGVSVKQIRT